MNAKKAKQLRRQAEQESVGMPARRTLSLKAHISNPRTKARIQYLRSPNGLNDRAFHPAQVVNDPESTRGIYRSLKSRA